MILSQALKRNRYHKQEIKEVRRVARRKLRYEILEERRVLAGELAQLTYQFFALNPDGTTGRNLDPNPSDEQLVANVQVGERFVVRTLVKDLRTSPQGVFSTFSDFNYTNADGASSEKMRLQWGEYNTITIGNGALAGTFQLRYGANSTSNISVGLRQEPAGTFVRDRNLTASNIQVAIASLPNVGNANVSVIATSDTRYRVSFRNALARADMPNPELLNNSLNTGGSNPAPVAVTVEGVNNPSPTTPLVLEGCSTRRQFRTKSFYTMGEFLGALSIRPQRYLGNVY